jgi:hypothetical protein
MTKEQFESWYKSNYRSFIEYKARYLLQKEGKSFSEIQELIHNTVEIVYSKLDSLNEENLKGYFFITMRNCSYNMFYNSFYVRNICCGGDMGMSDWEYSEDNSLKINPINLIDENIEVLPKQSHIKALENYSRLEEKEKKIIDSFVETNKYQTIAKFKISPKTVEKAIELVKTGNFEEKVVKVCTVCGDKHFSKGYCVKHYQQKRRNKI